LAVALTVVQRLQETK